MYHNDNLCSMISKSLEKQKAISLRKQGFTYSEILKDIPVSKSTLSLWLREVDISKRQLQRISIRKHEAQKRGGASRRNARLEKTAKIHIAAKNEITFLSEREFFLLGVVLYWAEGSKQSQRIICPMVEFANSDPAMIKFFIAWLHKFGNIGKDDIVLRLHLHDNHATREREIIKQWSQLLEVPVNVFCKTNFKKHNPKTLRTNVGAMYKGLISVRVRKSTDLNRRIQGLIYGIIDAVQ